MQECDYSSGCEDVYVWIALVVAVFIVTFLFCCRICRVSPLVCGNEIELCFRGSKEAVPSQSAGPASDVEQKNPSISQPEQHVDVRIEVSTSNSPQPVQESGQPHVALKVATRFVCAVALGYILAIIVVAIIVATTTPFPSVPASACSATCQTTDAYCCTYSPPFPHEDVYFSMSDGTKLHGWWIPSRNGSNGNLLYNHGSGENIAVMYRLLRYEAARARASTRSPTNTRPHKLTRECEEQTQIYARTIALLLQLLQQRAVATAKQRLCARARWLSAALRTPRCPFVRTAPGPPTNRRASARALAPASSRTRTHS